MILKKDDPAILSIEKIWNEAPHNGMTDLIFFNGNWYCIFRESDKHYKGENGRLRLLTSPNGFQWSSCALFEESGVDLRDPKLSITQNGQLMLLTGGTIYGENNKYISRRPRVAFSKDGNEWSAFVKILEDHEWLWSVTWHKGVAYGVSYRYSNPLIPSNEWIVRLYSSPNGVTYQLVKQLAIAGYPNETKLQFFQDEMIALVRRDKQDHDQAWIGSSYSPYTKWNWSVSGHFLGGPNFIILPNNEMWAAGRVLFHTPYGIIYKTALCRMTREQLSPCLFLPSNGDTGYPGMVFYNEELWISYYSSHETNAAIYLAKIKLPSVAKFK